jgi:hypothetical protein
MYEAAMKMVSLLQALLTPTIGIVTAYIAWRQYSEGRIKLNLDRYEKRLNVYKAVRGFLSEVVGTGQVSVEDIRRLRVDTSEASFLFGRDIPNYIDDLITHAAKLGAANDEYRDYNAPPPTPAGYDHAKITKIRHHEKLWLNGQFKVAEQSFGNYLRVV